MMGRLARDGLHPDQAPHVPVGVWCDAAWSAYADLVLAIPSGEHMDALNASWDELVAPLSVEVEAPEHEEQAGPGERRRPTQAERDAWGASARAQAGQANLVAMMGGVPPGAG